MLRKMFVVPGGSVTSVVRHGCVRITTALILMTLDIAYMKGHTVKRAIQTQRIKI